MGTTYQQVTDDDLPRGIMAEVREKWHQHLDDAGVSVGILFAANEDGMAIKAGKYKALASIQVLSLKLRALGCPDALMLIDAREWQDLSDASKYAVIDHELCHLELVEKEMEDGQVVLQRDDLGRPKLKTKAGDWNGGDAFSVVIERHGQDAIEFVNAQKVHSFAKASLPSKQEAA